MTIKLLNKDLTSFLTEPFAENFINAFKYNKKVKRLRKKSLNEGGTNVVSKSPSRPGVVGKNVGLTNIIEESDFLNLQSFKCIKVPSDSLYGPRGACEILHFIKGESLSIDMKTAENQIIKQFFENKCNTSVLGRKTTQSKKASENLNLLASQDLHKDSLSVIGSHFLFSLDQIRSEKLEQARFTSSKRVQDKSHSEFKKQLRECKKIRLLYGHLSKRDLKKSLVKVQCLQGLSSENLLVYLETRLDVILERCGFFPTIRSARQSILHGRIQVNFKVIKIPSYQLKPGNIIKVNLNKSNCVKIHSYPKVEACTNSPNPNNFSGVIQSDPAHTDQVPNLIGHRQAFFTTFSKVKALLNSGDPYVSHQQNFKVDYVDYLDLNSVPTKFKEDITNFSRSFKKSQTLSFFIRFLQTHLYFQSIFSLLLFFKNKNNSESKVNLEKAGNIDLKNMRLYEPIDLKNLSSQETIAKSISSVVVPFMSNWRFFLPPYALFSILEIQSVLYEKYVQTKPIQSGSIQNDLQLQVIVGCTYPFINVFHYWLEIKKKLLYPRLNFWGDTYSLKSDFTLASENRVNSDQVHPDQVKKINTLSQFESSIDEETSIQTSLSKNKNKKKKTSILYPSIQTNYLQKESKPLHLEVSYSSLCAIFLFPPQQIYFPAIIDLDLIIKLAGTKKK